MQKRKRGGQAGNKNAALPPGRKPRVAFSVSLHGERLDMVEKEAKQSGIDLVKFARKQYYAWLDERVRQRKTPKGDVPEAA